MMCYLRSGVVGYKQSVFAVEIDSPGEDVNTSKYRYSTDKRSLVVVLVRMVEGSGKSDSYGDTRLVGDEKIF